MGALGSWVKKLSLLFSRNRFRSELDEEMAFHREQAQRELMEVGMPTEEACYEATRRFGNATRMRERSQEAVGFRFETILQDVRFALRQFRKNPGFAATAILAGAVVGIAGSVAAATLMRKLLFGVEAWDLPTLAGVATVLASSAMMASYLPARRAASVSPADALRSE